MSTSNTKVIMRGGIPFPQTTPIIVKRDANKGIMPSTTLLTDKRYPEYEQIRFTIKNAWNTVYKTQLRNNNITKPAATPFRVVNNSGDILSRLNYSCGGTCQTPQSRPGLKGLSNHFGSVQQSCTPSAIYSTIQLNKSIPAAACNSKYVYDSSNYITYLKQSAINNNYNDFSNGGDNSHSSQSAIRAIRRY